MGQEAFRRELKDVSCDICFVGGDVFICSDGPSAIHRYNAMLHLAIEHGIIIKNEFLCSSECTGTVQNWEY